jgi:D-glycero-beta-D-manno-heptose-7-phosphate kinase
MKEENRPTLSTAFCSKRILIVGDVMLDEYVWGKVRRISPEAPVPIVETYSQTYVPGGAANAAANVACLGGQALLSGVVGRDQSAEKLREALRQSGVNPEGLIVDEQRPTTTKTRIIAQNQQVVRVDSERRELLRIDLEDLLLQWIESRMAHAHALVLSDYDKGVISPKIAKRCIWLARQAGKPVIVDPKGAHYSKYRGATVLTPNIHDAERASKCEINSNADLRKVGQQLSKVLEGSALLITRGCQGMALFLNGIETLQVPAIARHVFDVTGAGDTVVSTLALALAAGISLEDAVELSNRAAGIAVSKFGTTPVTMGELLTNGIKWLLPK